MARGRNKRFQISELEKQLAGLKKSGQSIVGVTQQLNVLKAGGERAQLDKAQEIARKSIQAPARNFGATVTASGSDDIFSLSEKIYGSSEFFGLLLQANPSLREGVIRRGMVLNAPSLGFGTSVTGAGSEAAQRFEERTGFSPFEGGALSGIVPATESVAAVPTVDRLSPGFAPPAGVSTQDLGPGGQLPVGTTQSDLIPIGGTTAPSSGLSGIGLENLGRGQIAPPLSPGGRPISSPGGRRIDAGLTPTKSISTASPNISQTQTQLDVSSSVFDVFLGETLAGQVESEEGLDPETYNSLLELGLIEGNPLQPNNFVGASPFSFNSFQRNPNFVADFDPSDNDTGGTSRQRQMRPVRGPIQKTVGGMSIVNRTTNWRIGF